MQNPHISMTSYSDGVSVGYRGMRDLKSIRYSKSSIRVHGSVSFERSLFPCRFLAQVVRTVCFAFAFALLLDALCGIYHQSVFSITYY